VFGLTTVQLLGLSVLAALVTTIGSLLATFLKDFLFARSLERWKDRRTLLAAYRKYRDPIIKTADDLLARVNEICSSYPTNYLKSALLNSHPDQLAANSAEDPYYKRYRLLSTVYRLCAFLGWLELYRQDVTFLDTGEKQDNELLEKALGDIRNDLADGNLNTASDHQKWIDRLIFREEQRAIGEAMIIGTSPRTVMGYGAFHALFEYARAENELWWMRVACNFLVDMADTKDFRRERFNLMRNHLKAAISLLSHKN
jgi:hypothetical protein